MVVQLQLRLGSGLLSESNFVQLVEKGAVLFHDRRTLEFESEQS
jgi:hypothetical protein